MITPIEKVIIKQAMMLLRTNTIDNMVEPPEDPEIQMAIQMAVGEINTTPPLTRLSLDHMWNNSSYRYLLTLGTAKYTLLTLVSDWVHNGLNATIDEFTLENRLNDYNTLLDRFGVEFSDRLKEVKPYLGRSVRTTNVKTPKISPRGNIGSPSLVTPFPFAMFRVK